jgi:transcriptional regulator with XRE-family HTH domain
MIKLKELRKKVNLTQLEVSKKIKIPSRTYANYENGFTNPDIITLIKLADFFQVSIDYLLDHEIYNKPAGEFYQLTDKQKELIPLIKQLNDRLCDQVSGFIEGKISKK